MRVFISWSGQPSQIAALALSDFLSKLWSTNVKPFVSNTDIEAGAQWQADILSRLDESNFGVICVTRANQHRPWINFEAGAIAKRMSESRCVPLAIDLPPAHVDRPLGMYQAKAATREGVWDLVKAVNNALDGALRPELVALEPLFDAFWDELAGELERARKQPKKQVEPSVDPAAQQRMIEEILITVRSIARPHPEQSAATQVEVPLSEFIDLTKKVFDLELAGLGYLDEWKSGVRVYWAEGSDHVEIETPGPVRTEDMASLSDKWRPRRGVRFLWTRPGGDAFEDMSLF